MTHKNTKKHKANHRGYISKPTKKAVNALLNLYKGVSILPEVITPARELSGTQLKLF